MNTYIFLYFLPGAGGNFFSRCLNLLESSYCFIHRSEPELLTNLVDKQQLLSYTSVNSLGFQERNWVEDFEKKLIHYSDIYVHHEIPSNSTTIWLAHPGDQDNRVAALSSPGNRNLKFYIDPTEAFEWMLLNGLFKNSYHDVNWFKRGKQLVDDADVYKVKLKNIIAGQDSFVQEFKRACDFLNKTVSDEELEAVIDLYQQWQTTVLPESKFAEFKKEIGFYI